VAEPRIIIFDLETLPNLKEALKVWPQLSNYPGLTLKASISTIICAGWKVLGEKKVNCINAWDFPEWDEDVNADASVCKALRDVLDGADAVVTQNGKRFDWKFLQTRLMVNKVKPLGKTVHIDTKQEAKRHLMLFNNRLNTLGEFLAGDKKHEHEGWSLWVDVWHRKKKAMRTMTTYCKQDVVVTEKVFKELRPLITALPNYNLFAPGYAGGKKVCPKCGGTRLQSKGPYVSGLSIYRRYVCKSCGGYLREPMNSDIPRSV